MTQHSLAYVFTAANQPLAKRQVATPRQGDLGKGEVLCRVEACTICGSDVRTLVGDRSGPTPCVLGHEIVGRIEAIGESAFDLEGQALSEGDRIVWSVAASCGACDRCREGIPQKCRKLFKYGHEPFEGDRCLNGGLAEHCRLAPGTHVVRVAKSLPLATVAPASCATATCAAAIRVAGRVEGKRALVFGAGALGLTAVAMLKTRQASEIVVCDPNQIRLTMSERMGANRTARTPAALTESPNGVLDDSNRFDLVLEMSGAPEAMESGAKVLGVGGVMVLVGAVAPTAPIRLDPESLVRRLIRIEGVHNYAPQDLAESVRFLEANHQRFPLNELVEATFTLHEANAAIQYAISSRPLRVMVTPSVETGPA